MYLYTQAYQISTASLSGDGHSESPGFASGSFVIEGGGPDDTSYKGLLKALGVGAGRLSVNAS